MTNIVFIMADQLRFDYLGCYGHPTIRTPNIDALAARGVRFDRAYVQSPICGPSRMSFYTGRYVRSHGSTWNGVPLRVGEMTLGDHLRPLGVQTVLCGKTHMQADREGMVRLGLDPETVVGARVAECGFDVWDRLDGLHPSVAQQPSHYQEHLRGLGYDGPNPWEQWANSAEGNDGEILSGWLMHNADRPARIEEPDSESPYATTRAIEFIEQAGGAPWCLHLSYIKPHWPYIVPPPYHAMYGRDDVLPAVRSEEERDNAHPVLAAYYEHRFSKVFCREEVRERVIPAYMGLITQIDDQVGRLVAYLEGSGRAGDTMIVFTSDHGDYLGDHWLGEKELFHEPSVRVPLIVVDPCEAADATRGTASRALVEGIDLAPTFVEFAGGMPRREVIEGHSLLPLLHGTAEKLRDHVISEYDYSFRAARALLDQPVESARLVMIFDGRFKLIEAEGFRPMLYDLETDPDELHDLGADPATHAGERARLKDALDRWFRRHHTRTTISDETILARAGGEIDRGIVIGFWDEAELAVAKREGRSGN